jgi:NTP pyrophosphatase (non-canonical NTP hydrolase)
MPDQIQRRALETWYEPGHELHFSLLPSVMGLAGETGELIDLVKKIHFKPGYNLGGEGLLDELGDVLFYLSIIAHQCNITLDELSQLNHHKLKEREDNGTGYNRGRDCD